jgi:hypothetical protein
MATFQNDWEGLASGTIPTTANTGNASGTAASAVSIASGDAVRATDFKAFNGSVAMAFEYLGPGAGATRILWAQADAGRYVFSMYFQITDVPTATEDVMGIRHAAGNMAILTIGADGKLAVQNAAGVGVSASKAANVLPVEQWIRIELSVQKGTSITDGYVGYSYYLNNSATPTFSWESSIQNVGTANVANPFIGRSTGRAEARIVYYDMVRGAALASGWLSPLIPSNAPPMVTLTASATGVEPGAVQELIATASDPDGTIASMTITQISGSPTVVLTGLGVSRQYIAPATSSGTILGFEAVAVDNEGATQASATVTHAIYPATERVTLGGVEVPVFIRVGE